MADLAPEALSPLALGLIASGRYDLLVAPPHALPEARRQLGGVTPDQLLVGPVTSPPGPMRFLRPSGSATTASTNAMRSSKNPRTTHASLHHSRTKPHGIWSKTREMCHLWKVISVEMASHYEM
jgi:hypothetical protein